MPDLATERAVVETLLALIPTGVSPGSLRYGDPAVRQPDIIGTTDSGGEVGFEVTEVIDPDLARSDPEASTIADQAREVLRRLTHTASGEHLPQGVTVSVEFETNTPGKGARPSSHHEKRQVIVPVVTDLLERGRGFVGPFESVAKVGSKTITARAHVILSPFRSCHFDCSEVVAFEIPLIERVKAKLDKSYQSGLPVHLVPFFRLSPYFNMDHWSEEIRRLIREDPRASRFAAIHVLDVRNGILLLSCPASSQ